MQLREMKRIYLVLGIISLLFVACLIAFFLYLPKYSLLIEESSPAATNYIQLLKYKRVVDKRETPEGSDMIAEEYWSNDKKYVAVHYWQGIINVLLEIYEVKSDKLKDVFTFGNKYVNDHDDIKLSATNYEEYVYIEDVKWKDNKAIILTRRQLCSNSDKSENRVFLNYLKTYILDPQTRNVKLFETGKYAYICDDLNRYDIDNATPKSDLVDTIKKGNANFKEDAEFSKCFDDAKRFLEAGFNR